MLHTWDQRMGYHPLMHVLPKRFKKARFFGFMTNRYRAGNPALCRMLPGQPLSDKEEQNKKMLEDAAFLFWKYFKDIY